MIRSPFIRTLLVVAAWLLAARADAQPEPRHDPSGPTVSFSLTAQAPPDVNLPPLCDDMGLPCGSPRTFPDFGVALSATLPLGSQLAVVGESSVFANHWFAAARTESTTIKAFLGGVRVQTRTFHPKNRAPIRLFGQLLGGGQWSSLMPGRAALQPGAGVEIGWATSRAVKVEYDYTAAHGPVRDLSGGRTVIGVVFGF
jgi:hypothetical protein